MSAPTESGRQQDRQGGNEVCESLVTRSAAVVEVDAGKSEPYLRLRE
jgi:hypothetical protein